MTGTLDAIRALPGVGEVSGPYGPAAQERISADGHTAYATVTFDHRAGEIPPEQARAVVDTAREAGGEGLQVELGGAAVALTEAPALHLSEAVGVAVAAVVLFLAFGSLAASLLPIATALVSVGTAYAGIALLGHVMTVADFAPMLGMLIGLGVGIDYALFIVTRHRRGPAARPVRARGRAERRRHDGPRRRLRRSHRLRRPARHAGPAAGLPQRRRHRRLAHRGADRRAPR